jgi:hypothetical protein
VDSSYTRERFTGWLYLVIFPYILPALICAYPAFRLSQRLRRLDATEAGLTQAKVTLVTVGGFFFFHLVIHAF